MDEKRLAEIEEKLGHMERGERGYLPVCYPEMRALIAEVRRLTDARGVYAFERERMRSMNDALIRHLSHIHGLIQPDHIALPDGRKMAFHPPDELVRQSWEALSKAIREIPMNPVVTPDNEEAK